jgi:hypothetical protein
VRADAMRKSGFLALLAGHKLVRMQLLVGAGLVAPALAVSSTRYWHGGRVSVGVGRGGAARMALPDRSGPPRSMHREGESSTPPASAAKSQTFYFRQGEGSVKLFVRCGAGAEGKPRE